MTATAQYPTREQSMAALELANTVRVQRAKIRQQVHTAGGYRESCLALAEVFRAGPPPCMATMRVEQALRWVHRMGPVSVRGFLEVAACSPYKKVRDLTPRQCERLADALSFWASTRRVA